MVSTTEDLLFEHLKKLYPSATLYEIALWTSKIQSKLSKKTNPLPTEIPKEIQTVPSQEKKRKIQPV